MNIIAVIPARAGSKGIPNKNVRLLNGHPLIYYAINNALKSKLITQIIVSTDSPVVKQIATQMGVEVHWRPIALCGDDITLDAVIYDATKDIPSDYIITMQPTSPTLKTTTLDAAIEYCIANNYDTVMSVINSPHLAWIKNSMGEIIPAYKERLNRQYLPPYFLETGAFFISRTSIVKENSRFGQLVNIYPISESEAIDIDSFADLRQAEHILSNKSIAIYVNGNNLCGTGHIYRALEPADEFYSKPTIYYDLNQTKRSVFGNTTHTLIPINGLNGLLSTLKNEQYNIFINDILSTTTEYMNMLRIVLPNAKIINFEDDGPGAALADIVINSLYNESDEKNAFTGERYYIAPKQFLFAQTNVIHPHVKTIFISFGGADPNNYTDRYLEIVSQKQYINYNFIAVLGRAKKNIDFLMGYNKYPNISVYFDVANMPELINKCDIAITSCGRTGYELALLGVPSIAMAQNERETRHRFISKENGFNYLGLNPSDKDLIEALDTYINLSYIERKQIQNTMLSHNLTQGRRNILTLLNT